MNNDKMQKLTAQLMEQAQVFASSWSLVGGPFDDGSALIDAEEARAELNSMIRDALSAATGGQESEAQAVAKVTVGNADHGPFRFEETPYGFDRLPDGETYLFAALTPQPENREDKE